MNLMGKEIKQTSQIKANNGAETLCLLKEAELPHQYWPTPLFAHPAPLSRPQNHEIVLFFHSLCPFLCVVVTYLVLMLWRRQIGTGMAHCAFFFLSLSLVSLHVVSSLFLRLINSVQYLRSKQKEEVSISSLSLLCFPPALVFLSLHRWILRGSSFQPVDWRLTRHG